MMCGEPLIIGDGIMVGEEEEGEGDEVGVVEDIEYDYQ